MTLEKILSFLIFIGFILELNNLLFQEISILNSFENFLTFIFLLIINLLTNIYIIFIIIKLVNSSKIIFGFDSISSLLVISKDEKISL
jgi:hypothetical protein